MFHAYGGLSGLPVKFFCTNSLQLFCLKLNKTGVYAAFIHLFLLLVSCLYLSEKYLILFFVGFFFAETEDALAK